MTRHSLAVATLLFACGGSAARPPAPEPSLAVAPLASIVPAAGLQTLVVVEPKALWSKTELRQALDALVPEDQVLAFATRHGSVDPRQLDEVAIAMYTRATLVLGRGVFEPARLEQAFGQLTLGIDGRQIDHAGSSLTTITRTWGDAAGIGEPNRHEELATFGHTAVGWELDEPSTTATLGVLRAAELFAQHKLTKSKPALEAPPLDAVNATLGPAPIRVFFAGPFEGEWATAMSGLLRAATAVGGSASSDGQGNLEITVAVFGAFGEKAPQAADRLVALVEVIGESALGKLAGLDHPTAPFEAKSTPDSAIVRGRVNAVRLVQGLRAATGAQISEIMKQ